MYYSVIAQLVKCVFVWIEWWHETIRVCYNNRAAIIIVVQSVVTCCGVVRPSVDRERPILVRPAGQRLQPRHRRTCLI